ncbi:MAG: hypothetical protein KDJ65_02390 [Anaerolineae bacterium]|nr:hypothetical protein [Anaerolineae bacterium]
MPISSKLPNYKDSFKESIGIQTYDVGDDHSYSVGRRTLWYIEPDCDGNQCFFIGFAHSSGVRFITCLLVGVESEVGCGNIQKRTDRAKELVEGRWSALGLSLGFGSTSYDGCIDTSGNVYNIEPGTRFCNNPDTTLKKYPSSSLLALLVSVIRSRDPNDKVGLPGMGDNHILAPGTKFNYTINFENLATATAPVQELIIEDNLDPNLDWSTFQFSDVTFGDQVVVVPTDPGEYQFSLREFPTADTVAGTTEGEMVIDMTGSLNTNTGRIEWRLKVIDTATDDFPTDPLAGFLPPEDGTGRGQGHVSFFIKHKANIPIGTRISNKARIIFDTNEPIETNEVWNIIGRPQLYTYLPVILR